MPVAIQFYRHDSHPQGNRERLPIVAYTQIICIQTNSFVKFKNGKVKRKVSPKRLGCGWQSLPPAGGEI